MNTKDYTQYLQDGEIKTIHYSNDLKPTTTLLNYLRANPNYKGCKEGCAEGDCGACTVVIAEEHQGKLQYKAIDSCLVLLPMLEGKQLITVESLKEGNELHPVQSAMVETNGSQCGYCTPGFVMSMFALNKEIPNANLEEVNDALTGNLCRCTGYKPIVDAALKVSQNIVSDAFNKNEKETIKQLQKLNKEETNFVFNTPEQKYFQPHGKAEALALKAKYPDALIINGSTDVSLRITKRHEFLNNIIDLSRVVELKKYTRTDYVSKFGAGMCLEEVKKLSKDDFTALHEALVVFGSKQIRELASLGGNIGSASPIGDTIPVLMTYNAEVKLQSATESRIVNINDFIIGYRKTLKREEELITSIIIPKPSVEARIKFYKVSKRKDLDISTVSACFYVMVEKEMVTEIRIAYGGMAERTKRATRAETFLLGQKWSRENIEQAAEIIYSEFTPLTDARSGDEYRKLAAKNLIIKFFNDVNS